MMMIIVMSIMKTGINSDDYKLIYKIKLPMLVTNIYIITNIQLYHEFKHFQKKDT